MRAIHAGSVHRRMFYIVAIVVCLFSATTCSRGRVVSYKAHEGCLELFKQFCCPIEKRVHPPEQRVRVPGVVYPPPRRHPPDLGRHLIPVDKFRVRALPAHGAPRRPPAPPPPPPRARAPPPTPPPPPRPR